jgi:hypothetical protein
MVAPSDRRHFRGPRFADRREWVLLAAGGHYDADQNQGWSQLKTIGYGDNATPNVTNIAYGADGQRTSITGWHWHIDLGLGQPAPADQLHQRSRRPGAVRVQPAQPDDHDHLSG